MSKDLASHAQNCAAARARQPAALLRRPMGMAASSVSPMSPLGQAPLLAGYRPTPAQRRFLQLALASRGPLYVAALCRQVGISRSSYYRWLAEPGFRAWMSVQWVQALLADGGRLLSIARARAASDFRYWRALADLVFDPRGLGLLTAWQQRLAEDPAVAAAPLFAPDDPEIDDDLDALEPTWDQIGSFSMAPSTPAEPEEEVEADEEVETGEAQEVEEQVDAGTEDAQEVEEREEEAPDQPAPSATPTVTPSDPVESTTYKPAAGHFPVAPAWPPRLPGSGYGMFRERKDQT